MASSAAATVAQYLAELPPERRAVVARMRDLVLANLPAGYEEGMDFGMMVWFVPLARYPDTYNGHPLGYAALAAQKHYYALYLSTYMSQEHMTAFERAFADAGKRMDMGKSCLRFKALEELPLDVVAREIGRTSPDELIALYERSRAGTASGAKAKPTTKTKAPANTKTAGNAKTPSNTPARKRAPAKRTAPAKASRTSAAKRAAPRSRRSATS